MGDSLVASGDTLTALGLGHGGCPPPPSPPLLPPPPPSPFDASGTSLDSKPGKLWALKVGNPLVVVGDMLGPLEVGGGVTEVSETTPLGGVIDGCWLLMGPIDSADVVREGVDGGLGGGGPLGCDVGDRLVTIEGSGLVPDPEPADGGDPGDVEGGMTLEGPGAEDTVVREPELGGSEAGEPALLGALDVVAELIPEGTLLLAIGETVELAGGLADPLGFADDRRLDAGLTLVGGGGLPEVGEPELGIVVLDAADNLLLGIADDVADGLPTLDATGLVTDGGRLADDVPPELPTLTGEDCPELAVDGTLETPLASDEPLSCDAPLGGDEPLGIKEPLGADDPLGGDDKTDVDDPLGSDEAPEPLDGLPDEAGEKLDTLADEPAEVDADDGDRELSEPIDFVLSEDGWFDHDDGSDDCPDEPRLREFEDREPELPEGDDPLSDPLERDKLLSEPLDPDDERPDDSDELRTELLRSELLGQLDDERSDEPLLDSDLPLKSELREPPSELSSDELRSELEPLLPEDSLDELGEDRDDSLTLENDLLDP